MTKSENRCSYCGGKFGLVCHYHWGLRFCRKPPGQIELAASKRLARRLAEPPSPRREQHQGFQIGSAAGAAADGAKTGLAYGTAHGPAR